jgi:glycosyltransferase involved in cell wall biosynthesis
MGQGGHSVDIYVDGRWPQGSGIERVYKSHVRRLPESFNLHELPVSSRIGSPFSCLALSHVLYQRQPSKNSVFWNPGFVPILPLRVKKVVTVHDLIHLHFYTKAHRLYYNAVFKPLYRCCDLIVCISEFTRNEFLEWSGMPSDRVIVVPNAVESSFAGLAQPTVTPRPFFFYAGNRRTYKNVPLMVECFFKAGLHLEGYDLYLTGACSEDLISIARRAGGENHLRFLGFLQDQALVAYYKSATAVCFLSSYEGFGLPILEAMACEVPLILSSETALPEVAGEAALYVNPHEPESVVEGFKTMAFNDALRASFVEKGRLRLANFSQDESSAQLWSTIAQL